MCIEIKLTTLAGVFHFTPKQVQLIIIIIKYVLNLDPDDVNFVKERSRSRK